MLYLHRSSADGNKYNSALNTYSYDKGRTSIEDAGRNI
jgi:hypothetical protein